MLCNINQYNIGFSLRCKETENECVCGEGVVFKEQVWQIESKGTSLKQGTRTGIKKKRKAQQKNVLTVAVRLIIRAP